MTNDARTTNRNWPKPHPDNLLSEDMARLIHALEAMDVDVAGLLTAVAGRALLSHGHAIPDIAGLQATLDGKKAADWTPSLDDLSDVTVAGAASGQFLRLIGSSWQPATISVAWGDVSGRPASFPTTWSDVAGKPATFAPSAHGHTIGEVTGLQGALDGKLPLAGGTLTGALSGTTASFGGGVTGQAVDSGNAFQVNNSLGSVIAAISPVNRGGGNYSVAVYGYGGSAGSSWRMILEHDGSVYFPRTQINPDGSLEINQSGTGDRSAYVDLHSHGTPYANDFSARIIRYGGAGGFLDIINTGGGVIRALGADFVVQRGENGVQPLMIVDAANPGTERPVLELRKNSSARLQLSGEPSAFGGAYYDSPNGTSPFHAFYLGALGQKFRIRHDNLFDLPDGTGVIIGHSGNWGVRMIAGDTQDVGKYVFAYCSANGVNFGGSVAGNFLFPASHAGYQAGSINGTWRAQGYGLTGHITLWQRVA